jgi:hypothetical protein
MTGKSCIKFTYTSYDYSFLRPKPSFWESKVLPIVERAYAKTIGADLTTIKPMSEPSGQLFWLDTSFTAAAEPDNTASATTNDSVSAFTTRLTYDYSGYRKKLREERTKEYFKRKNYFKKIRNR